MLKRTVTDERVFATLQAVFGYTTFRPLQHEIVRSILDGQDVFVLMPTGGGKSLCYQLPALLSDGLTIVVSPLIALMKDQVDRLLAMGVAATFINSSLDQAEIGRRQADVARGDVKLLYVAPERLMLPGFLRLLSSVPLSCFAVDEAHCISEWGHDFRPEYRELTRLRSLFPAVPLATFTATATPRVQADIIGQLGLQPAANFRGSFNRPNLFYDVRAKQGAYEQLFEYLRGRGDASGIIYCQSRLSTERLAERLQADGFRAAAYHAGLDNQDRRLRQEAFVRDDVRIVVATIAFGMGIDKPDVRFVVHYDLPKNLEGYYQETGRAGRDGEPSDCILFYGYGDAVKQEHFIRQKPSASERAIATQQLREMVAWAESSSCRRRALLAYFEEPLDGQPEPCCDVCRVPEELKDCTTLAQKFLSCVNRTGERFGAVHVIGVLRGMRDERILRLGHDQLPTYGIGRDLSLQEWRHLVQGLLRAGYIRAAADEFNAVKVTERGNAVLRKGETVLLPAARVLAAPQTGDRAVSHAALFDRLRELRKRLADERGIPPYVIFHDTTLRQMAAALPATLTDLLRIQGVGERKLQDCGAPFLAAIAGYVRETGALPEGAPASPPRRPRPARPGPTILTTLDLFTRGMSPSEIADHRSLALSTIEGHLAEAIEAGEQVDIRRLIDERKRRAIEAAIGELGPAPLGPLLEHLGAGYSYGEIRFVRAALERQNQPGG